MCERESERKRDNAFFTGHVIVSSFGLAAWETEIQSRPFLISIMSSDLLLQNTKHDQYKKNHAVIIWYNAAYK